MAESEIQVTSAGGTRVRTDTKSIGGQTRHQEYHLQGEHSLATYAVYAGSVSITNANDHVFQIMAGSTLPVRIRVIRVWQAGLAGTVNTGAFDVFRLTTAGTGGTAITPRPLDSADAASGATAMTLPTVKGTEGVALLRARLAMVAAQPTNADGPLVVYEARTDAKPLIIPSGTSNGIALKNLSAIASPASVDFYVEFVETSFV